MTNFAEKQYSTTKMRTRGKGVKNPQYFSDILYERSLRLAEDGAPVLLEAFFRRGELAMARGRQVYM